MLMEKLTKDIITAMKEKDQVKKSVLTVLKSNAQNKEKELKRDLSEEDELAILNRERKQINDSIEMYTKGNRPDLVEQEEKKLQVVVSYLPKQLTKEDIVKVLAEKNLTKQDNVGKVIGELSKQYKGQIEGKVLADTVKEYFNTL